jgi:hypothetical protein
VVPCGEKSHHKEHKERHKEHKGSSIFNKKFVYEKGFFTLHSKLLLMVAIQNLYSQERYQATWESLKKYQTPEWFSDVKFGIFIHWGVYSVPAFGNEWYPRNMYRKDSKEYKHHIEKYGSLNKFGYKDFIPMFKGESSMLRNGLSSSKNQVQNI